LGIRFGTKIGNLPDAGRQAGQAGKTGNTDLREIFLYCNLIICDNTLAAAAGNPIPIIPDMKLHGIRMIRLIKPDAPKPDALRCS
jgi:hypothetical protein